jgi:PAS domain-containing protein
MSQPALVPEQAITAGAAALSSLAIPILLLGRDGRIRAVSAPARTLVPAAEVDAPLAAALSVPLEELFAAAESAPPRSLPALLRTAAEPILVLVQPMPVADGLLLLIVSLDAVRNAEERRFLTTPYGTIRVGLNGAVRFANPAAKRFWGDEELEGREFVSLFPQPFHDAIRARLNEVLATGESRSVDLTTGGVVYLGERVVRSNPRVTFLPEFVTGSTLHGVLVVIRERVLDALRVALREEALGTAATEAAAEPGGGPASTWRQRTNRMLDLLRYVLPHDLAIVVEMSNSGGWSRPILLHPEPQQRWPRMWWRVSDDERAQLQSSAPYSVELADWLRDNPDRKNEPLLQLLLEARPKGEGMVSFAVMPIRPHERTVAVLILASARPYQFQPSDKAGPASEEEELLRDPLAVLGGLGLSSLLATMLRHAKRDGEVVRTGIAASIEAAETVPQATLVLLRQLVEYFGWDHAAVYAAHRTDTGEAFRLFAQHPETEDGARHPLAIPQGYTQPLYDPGPGAPLDEALAGASGMLGAAVRDARRRGTGVLVAPDVMERDAAGRPPHWFRSISDAQRSALTIAITINGRTRWVLDTVSRYRYAFIEEDGDQVAPLVKRLATRVSALRDRKLNDRLIRLIDEGVLITDESGVILRANPRAREVLGLEMEDDGADRRRLGDFVRGPEGAALPQADREEKRLLVGPASGLGVEARIRRLEDPTEISDVIWLLSGADRETYNVNTRYIAETVQEVARQVRGPLLLAAYLCGRLGRGAQDTVAPVARQARAEIAKADITFERLAEGIGARQVPKREDRAVALGGILAEVRAALPESDGTRLHIDAEGDSLVTGDRGRLAFALRTLLGHMLARDTGEVNVKLRHVNGQAELGLSGTELPSTTEAAAPEDAVRAAALEAAAHGQDSVRAVLAAHGGSLEPTSVGFQLQLPLALGVETQP